MKEVSNGVDSARRSRHVLQYDQRQMTTVSVRGRFRRSAADLVTSFYELPFVCHLVAMVVALFGSWTLFGLGWWALAAAFDDLGEQRLSDTTRPMCINKVFDFANALMFSVETQTTLGYGSRVVNPHCSPSMVLLILQLVLGAAIDCLAAGFLFDKLTRPSPRSQVVRFSSKAVVYRRVDGNYVLAFRVWYSGPSTLLGLGILATAVRQTEAGVEVGSTSGLLIETEAGDRFMNLPPWPETLIHLIISSSPLSNLTPSDLDRLEVIVAVTGTVESTGVSAQYVTSYTGADIVWGRKFAPLRVNWIAGQLKVDCSAFDETADWSAESRDDGEAPNVPAAC